MRSERNASTSWAEFIGSGLRRRLAYGTAARTRSRRRAGSCGKDHRRLLDALTILGEGEEVIRQLRLFLREFLKQGSVVLRTVFGRQHLPEGLHVELAGLDVAQRGLDRGAFVLHRLVPHFHLEEFD